MFPKALVLRFLYRRGFPFLACLALAGVTAAWPRFREAHFHEGTSLWTFAILAGISTTFVLVCGGRFRIFYIALAVTPPLLLVLPGWVLGTISNPDFPIRGFVEYALYFVATPVLLVWCSVGLLNRRRQVSGLRCQ